MSFLEGNSISLLAELLRQPDEPSTDEEDDRLPAAGIHRFGPGDIGSKKKSTATHNCPVKFETPKEENKPQTIEEWEEMTLKEDEDLLENRKRPSYSIRYKQKVTTEDIYLQMGNKTPGTASCEDMIVEVEMPENKVPVEKMELSVCREEIDLKTPIYRLKLALPHPIDPDKGNAQWDKETGMLTLTLRMNREFDFVNF